MKYFLRLAMNEHADFGPQSWVRCHVGCCPRNGDKCMIGPLGVVDGDFGNVWSVDIRVYIVVETQTL